MEIIKTKKSLKNSKEILDFFIKKKLENGIIPYKNGWAIIQNKKIDKIYLNIGTLKKIEE